ncbi:MAG: AraC family transcriptional regulator [Pseudomonadota bacterium]
MVQEFSDYSKLVQASNEEVHLNGGVIWHSTRLYGPPVEHDAPLPPGLHITSGIGNVWAYSKECGGFETVGASLSIVLVPEGGTIFQTKLQAGAAQSMGYYLPTAAMETDDPVLETLRKTAVGKPLLCWDKGASIRTVPRLTSLISSAFQGDVRDALLKARAIELTALIAAEVGEGATSTLSGGHSRSAFAVRDLIEAELSTELRLEDLARANETSIRTMTNAFRETFDESIGQYIRRRRMEEAAIALEQGASVAEAAFLVGYSPNAFSSAFKKHFNRKPSA